MTAKKEENNTEQEFVKNNDMGPFAFNIMQQKYAHIKNDGSKETWEEIAHRVASTVMKTVNVSKSITKEIEDMIAKRKFMPGGRYLAASGRPFHQVQNCLLLRAEDSREGWSDLMGKITLSLMTGAGIGVVYSDIRGEGKIIRKTGGVSTGPLALMQMVNEAGRGIRQGGDRRCLPKGSLVHTIGGLKVIENVKYGDKVLTFDGFKPVLANLHQGTQKTIKIITQTGEFICTPNHRVAVLSSINGDYMWTEAQHLKEDDRLCFTAVSIPGIETFLPKSNYVRSPNAHTVKEITIPNLDSDLAWFLGYMHANGHVSIIEKSPGKRNSCVQITVPNDAKSVMEKGLKQLQRFGVSPSIQPGDGDCSNIRVASIPLALWFIENFKEAKKELVIPEFILEGTTDIRSAYLAGVLDGDGCIKNRPIVCCSSIYKLYLSQLQTVYASLGITTRLVQNREAKNNWKALYTLTLKGSKQEHTLNSFVGPFLVYKKLQKRERSKEMFSYSFPYDMSKEAGALTHKNNNAVVPVENVEEKLGISLPFTPVRVLDIVEGEELETFDIEVEDRNEFYCNGFLVHNSAIWAGLHWNHPDCIKFIQIKNWSQEVRALKDKDYNFPGALDGTNVSIILDDDFFKAYNNESNKLHTHAQSVYWAVVRQMLKTAEPGFSIDCGDNKGENCRNACTEITSRDDSDICNLGSINMARIDSLEEMERITELGIIFLLAGTIYSDVPYAKVDQIRTKNRRLGLGLMGLHEWLLKKGKKYGPDLELEEYLKIYSKSTEISWKYADEWEITRPVKTRAIAPTGTIGILGETTTGLEPIYCVAYKRRYLKGNVVHYQYVVDPAAKRLIDSGISPEAIEDSYVLAENVERRVEFQAWVQQYVDHAISSTINLPSWGSPLNNDSLVRDFGNMLYKYLPKLRGITCYPDGARGGQPLTPVKYTTAIKHIGEEFSEVVLETADMCDITKGGSCGV